MDFVTIAINVLRNLNYGQREYLVTSQLAAFAAMRSKCYFACHQNSLSIDEHKVEIQEACKLAWEIVTQGKQRIEYSVTEEGIILFPGYDGADMEHEQ